MKDYKGTLLLVVFASGLWAVAGCTQESAPTTSTDSSAAAPSIDGSQYLTETEPNGAKDVIDVRENSQDGDEVVIVGRIGGSATPWVEGLAAFSIVDGSLDACSDIPGDHCPTPWDYCCATDKLPTSTALVKVVDDGGDVVKADARELLKVQELSTVVVQGKAQRDDAGNLTVIASRIYVK